LILYLYFFGNINSLKKLKNKKKKNNNLSINNKNKVNYDIVILYYYSDYYKNRKLRKEIVKFEIPNNIEKGKYVVEIYAIDSFNNVSNQIIRVIDI
jgi:hypothetical protein